MIGQLADYINLSPFYSRDKIAYFNCPPVTSITRVHAYQAAAYQRGVLPVKFLTEEILFRC